MMVLVVVLVVGSSNSTTVCQSFRQPVNQKRDTGNAHTIQQNRRIDQQQTVVGGDYEVVETKTKREKINKISCNKRKGTHGYIHARI